MEWWEGWGEQSGEWQGRLDTGKEFCLKKKKGRERRMIQKKLGERQTEGSREQGRKKPYGVGRHRSGREWNKIGNKKIQFHINQRRIGDGNNNEISKTKSI